MTSEADHLSIGSVISSKLWDKPVRIDNLDLLGDFLKLRVSGLENGFSEERLVHPQAKSIRMLIDDETWVDAIPPTREELELLKPESTIKEGMIVETRQRLWRIDSIDPQTNTATVVSVSGPQSRHELYLPIEDIRPAGFPPPDLGKIGNPRFQKMLMQSLGFNLIHSSAVLTGLQRSGVIPMPFQLVPVIMALNLPQARLLIADDVGLGKTIEAGLILSELVARNKANRVLIVTPANLCEQWQETMNRFFHFNFRIISKRQRRILERELMVGGNPWIRFPKLIVSVDYVKQDEVLGEALAENWDLVIIDEAHKIAKPHQTTKGSDPTMKRYQLGKKLASSTEHLLLLTATPHNGYRDTFASLLELLNPEIVKGKIPDISIQKNVAMNHVCQRRRSDVEEWFRISDEKSPFPASDRKELFVSLSYQHEQIMTELKTLSKHILSVSKDVEKEKRLAQWTVIHFYKRALSSPYALECSIRNRLAKIRQKIENKSSESEMAGLTESELRTSALDDDPGDYISEEEIDARTPKIIFGTASDAKLESQILSSIMDSIKGSKPSNDNKLMRLLRETLPDTLSRSKRVIIFTRFKDTLDYLEREIRLASKKRLALEGTEVFSIYGEMGIPKRKDVFKEFKTSSKAVLITTDCMSEGIDLQYSSDTVMHYELPWNPNRLEQRNGRVDRFGQPSETVFIRTFVTQNSVEARILDVIIEKAQKIREDFGFAPPFFGDDLMILDTLREYGEYTVQTTLEDFDKVSENKEIILEDPYTNERLKEIQADSFYGQAKIDLSQVQNRMKESIKALGKPEDIEAFVKSAFSLLGGSFKDTNKEGILECHLPSELQDLSEKTDDEKFLVTFNRDIGSTDPDLHILDLQSPIVRELVSKMTEKVYVEGSEYYGRTSAVATTAAEKVSAIFHIRFRFIVKTEPLTMVEELSKIGLSVWSNEGLDDAKTNKLWDSSWKSHGKSEDELLETLEETLHHVCLLQSMTDFAEKIRSRLTTERKELKEQLAKDGLSRGLRGMDDIELSSMDIVGVSLFYPSK